MPASTIDQRQPLAALGLRTTMERPPLAGDYDPVTQKWAFGEGDFNFAAYTDCSGSSGGTDRNPEGLDPDDEVQ